MPLGEIELYCFLWKGSWGLQGKLIKLKKKREKREFPEIALFCYQGSVTVKAGLWTGLWITSYPGMEGGGERTPGIHCLCMLLIATELYCDRICTCVYVYWRRHILTALMNQLAVRVSLTLRCSMPSIGWVPRDKAQERTDCLHWVHLPRKHTFMCDLVSRSLPDISGSLYPTVKLGRACSSKMLR